MKTTTWIRPGIACLVLAGLACSGRDLNICDITQRACQQSIYYRVLNLRGDGYDPFGGLPPVSVISEDTFRAKLEKDAADQAARRGPSPWDRGLVLLHFETPSSPPAVDGGAGVDGGGSGSTIDDEVAHVAAFYDPPSKTVTIVAHPNQTGATVEFDNMETLAHELVHALQDREVDLGRTAFSSADQYFAWAATVEGDARFYEYLFVADLIRAEGKTPKDPTTFPDLELGNAYSSFDELGAPMFAARYFIYPLGAKYEATAYRSGGNAAVRHAYANAPQKTVALLVGDDGRVPPVSNTQACAPPIVAALPLDDTHAGFDHFGALLFYTFLRGWGVDHATAFATAQTWTADSLLVQSSQDFTTTAVAWRVEFSAAPPPVIAAKLSATGELAVKVGPRSLEITVGESPTPLSWPTTSCP